jgi:hypothetical protein
MLARREADGQFRDASTQLDVFICWPSTSCPQEMSGTRFASTRTKKCLRVQIPNANAFALPCAFHETLYISGGTACAFYPDGNAHAFALPCANPEKLKSSFISVFLDFLPANKGNCVFTMVWYWAQWSASQSQFELRARRWGSCTSQL